MILFDHYLWWHDNFSFISNPWHHNLTYPNPVDVADDCELRVRRAERGFRLQAIRFPHPNLVGGLWTLCNDRAI